MDDWKHIIKSVHDKDDEPAQVPYKMDFTTRWKGESHYSAGYQQFQVGHVCVLTQWILQPSMVIEMYKLMSTPQNMLSNSQIKQRITI